jgi:hypothetical protein
MNEPARLGIPLRPDAAALASAERRSFVRACAAMALATTPEGGGRDGWPKSLRLDCHRRFDGHTDVYGRLAWDRPAAGLTTRCISYSNGRFGQRTPRGAPRYARFFGCPETASYRS